MNVIGKIKSKRHVSKTQVQKIVHEEQQLPQNISQSQFPQSYQTQIQQEILEQKTFQSKKAFKPMKPVQESDYFSNTNILTKQKEIALKQKQTFFTRSIDSAFLPSFKKYKSSKNSNTIVYYDSNASLRSSSLQIDQNLSSFSYKVSKSDSFDSEEEENVDLQFLLYNKQNKEVRPMFQIPKGKIYNIEEIQSRLKAQNQQVIRFFMKRWFSYGDIYVLDGEIESLKKGYIMLDIDTGQKKVDKKMRIKLSCDQDILESPQEIKIIYLSQVSFLSQKQGMIIKEYFLKVIEELQRFGY